MCFNPVTPDVSPVVQSVKVQIIFMSAPEHQLPTYLQKWSFPDILINGSSKCQLPGTQEAYTKINSSALMAEQPTISSATMLAFEGDGAVLNFTLSLLHAYAYLSSSLAYLGIQKSSRLAKVSYAAIIFSLMSQFFAF